MLGCVVAITAEVCQVDPADKRDFVVDHDELLVVAVHGALVGVKRGLDARAVHELVASLAHGLAARRERRHRSPGP
jgi:hypothetical protein